MMSAFIEALRYVLWLLGWVGLFLADMLYSVMRSVATINFFNDPRVWQWWGIMMLFMGVIIFIRMFTMFLKVSFDEDYQEKFKGSKIIMRMIVITLTIALLPITLKWIGNVSAFAINNTHLIVGSTTSTPSTMLLTSYMNKDTVQFDAQGNVVATTEKQFTLDEITPETINKKNSQKEFEYLPATTDVLIIMLMSFTLSVFIILNAIQIAKRAISLVFKLIISPLPIGNSIDPEDDTFAMWRKMVMSDYLLNYFQVLLLIIVMLLANSPVVNKAGIWPKMIILIAAFLLLLGGMPEIAKLLGGEVGSGGILQQVANFRMATRGMGDGIKNTLGNVANVATAGLALGAYSAGRMGGGKSIRDVGGGFAGSSGNSGSSMFNNSTVSQDSKNVMTSQNDTRQSQSNNSMSQQNHATSQSQNSLNQQNQASSHNLNNQQNQTMSQRQNSMNQQNQTSNQNQNMQSQNDLTSRFNDQSSNQQNMQASQYQDNHQQASLGTSQNQSNDRNMPQYNNQGVTRPGTKANAFASKVAEARGIKGVAGRLISSTSAHAYKASMNRLQSNPIYKKTSVISDIGKNAFASPSKPLSTKGGYDDGIKDSKKF